jgi:hypothetical protein
MITIPSTNDFLTALCPHLPGNWRRVDERTISDGNLAIFSYHDNYRRKRIFGPHVPHVNGYAYYEDPPRITVAHHRQPQSVVRDIVSRLLPDLPGYFDRYRAWRDSETAHKQRREGVAKLLMQVAGVNKVGGLNPYERPMLYSQPQHTHWWRCEIQATHVEIQCRVEDPETAAAILELLTT